jgi:DNA repair protein RecO (recombination protein O)
VQVHAQPAFVLHAQPWRETSLLVELFTRDFGRIGVVARGVHGPKAQPLRAALQPLQPLQVGWEGRGELPWLRGAEAAGAAFAPQGDALLATFYVNELLWRLLPRGESHAALFWRYLECLSALQAGEELGWQLRRFERDLLLGLGYGLALEHEADGVTPLRGGRHYRYEPEQGALPMPGGRADTVSGEALLALAADQPPPVEAAGELRRMMRRVLRHYLGGRELRSWQVLADLAPQRALPRGG